MKCFRGGLIELGHFLDIGAADHALLALPGDHQHPCLRLAASASKPFADAGDGGRSKDIERAGVADRQANDTARIAVNAAIGIEHVHELARHSLGAPERIVPLPGQNAALSSAGQMPPPLRRRAHCEG